jgi:hypothetical protein
MAFIVKCAFCGHDATDHDHDGCAKDFGDSLKQQVFDWHAQPQGVLSVFPFADRFKGEKWEAYLAYLERLKVRAETERKCENLTTRVQDRLQPEGNRIIATLDPNFQVKVNVICTLIPRC